MVAFAWLRLISTEKCVRRLTCGKRRIPEMLLRVSLQLFFRSYLPLFLSRTRLCTSLPAVIYVFACSSMTWNEIFSLSRALINDEKGAFVGFTTSIRFQWHSFFYSFIIIKWNSFTITMHKYARTRTAHPHTSHEQHLHTQRFDLEMRMTHKCQISWNFSWNKGQYSHTHSYSQTGELKWMRHNMTCAVWCEYMDNTDYIVIG